MILSILQILGLEFYKILYITRTFFSHRRSFQFWKQNTINSERISTQCADNNPQRARRHGDLCRFHLGLLSRNAQTIWWFFSLFLWRQRRHSSLDWVHNGTKILFKSYLNLGLKKRINKLLQFTAILAPTIGFALP